MVVTDFADGRAMLVNDSGQVWDTVGDAYETAPSSGAIPAENLLTPTQVGGASVYIYTIPAGAESSDWSLIIYHSTTPDTADAVDAAAEKPAPTTAEVNAAIVAGQVGIDTAATKTIADSTNLSVAALNDPTAAAVATAVRSELTTELGRIDAAVSSVGGTVDAAYVPPELTHYIEGHKSRSIIRVNQGFAGTIQCSPDLDAGTAISGVTSCVLSGAADVTATNPRRTTNLQNALATVAALTTAGTYTATWTLTTTTSQTLVLTGTLIVE